MSTPRPASWLPFILVALALGAGTMGATMASPLFPIYEDIWGIKASEITVIYVVYMAGVLVAFLFMGWMPGRFGPVPMLRVGAVLLLSGLILSTAAQDVVVLGAARLIIGVASGLTSAAATLGLLEVEPGAVRRAPIVTSSVTMAGFGAGPLVCGLTAQFLPMPLVTPYLVIALPIAVILMGLCAIHPRHEAMGRVTLRPNLGLPHKVAIPGFLLASLAVFSAYALFSLLASLAPSFLAMILPWSGPAVSGTALGVVLFCSALIQIPLRRLHPRKSLPLAFGLLMAGSLFLAIAVAGAGALAFVLADVLIGMGHGLAFMTGVALVNLITTERNRPAVFSSFFCIAYLGAIVPILAVGWMADHFGLTPAVAGFAGVATLVCLAALPFARRMLEPARIG